MHVRRVPTVPTVLALRASLAARPASARPAIARLALVLLASAALTTTARARARARVGVAQARPPGATRIRLSRNTVLAGVRCAPTGRASAALHANGALDECPLVIDTVIAGHLLLRGTWLRLTPDRGLDGAWLPRDAMLQGLPCKGTGYKGWAARFHPDGALSLCYLSREATIDSLPCRPGAFVTELSGSTQVALHPTAGCVAVDSRAG